MTNKTNLQMYKKFKRMIIPLSDLSLATLKVVVENEERYRIIKGVPRG